MSQNRTLLVSAALTAFVLVVAGALASPLVGSPVTPSSQPQQAAEPEVAPFEAEITAPTRHEDHEHHEKAHHHHDHDDDREDDDG